MKKLIIGGLAALAIAGVVPTPISHADPGVGCETLRWGFLGSQRRTICDGPIQADGSWLRARVVWTPAGYVPRYTYCGTYSCSSSGGYYREETLQAKETTSCSTTMFCLTNQAGCHREQT